MISDSVVSKSSMRLAMDCELNVRTSLESLYKYTSQIVEELGKQSPGNPSAECLGYISAMSRYEAALAALDGEQ